MNYAASLIGLFDRQAHQKQDARADDITLVLADLEKTSSLCVGENIQLVRGLSSSRIVTDLQRLSNHSCVLQGLPQNHLVTNHRRAVSELILCCLSSV